MIRISRPKSYTLENATEKNRLYPDTFEIPEREELESLRIGDIVKLIFIPTDEFREEEECGGERMWVIITKIDGNQYVGTLDNQPMVIHELEIGGLVRFKRENIASLWS